jgi:hypothetical protein
MVFEASTLERKPMAQGASAQLGRPARVDDPLNMKTPSSPLNRAARQSLSVWFST